MFWLCEWRRWPSDLRLAAKDVNKQSWTADEVWFACLEVWRGGKNPWLLRPSCPYSSRCTDWAIRICSHHVAQFDTTLGSSEILVVCYHTTRRHTPEGSLYSHSREKVRFLIKACLLIRLFFSVQACVVHAKYGGSRTLCKAVRSSACQLVEFHHFPRCLISLFLV